MFSFEKKKCSTVPFWLERERERLTTQLDYVFTRELHNYKCRNLGSTRFEKHKKPLYLTIDSKF